MALFDQNKDLVQNVLQLRQQGLTDEVIDQELKRKGFNEQQINQAISQANTPPAPGSGDVSGSGGAMPSATSSMGPNKAMSSNMNAVPNDSPGTDEGNIYERIEQITESMIDEKWDELIAEVKKIVSWKEKIEDRQNKIQNDLDKLKEDFKGLHHGVLGKLEDYDKRMQDVGTELKAVGKVFKDVVPEFVDNVKELKEYTGKVTGSKKKD